MVRACSVYSTTQLALPRCIGIAVTRRTRTHVSTRALSSNLPRNFTGRVQVLRFLALAAVVGGVFAASLGPFIVQVRPAVCCYS